MEMRAQHIGARGPRRRDQLRFKHLGVAQKVGGYAAKIGQHMAAGRGVHRHLCDPPDDQPDPPDELPQLLLLLLRLPLPPLMLTPGELAPVAAITTTKA